MPCPEKARAPTHGTTFGVTAPRSNLEIDYE